jgi:hypothetical protein
MQWEEKSEIRSGEYKVYFCGSEGLKEALKYLCMKAYCEVFLRKVYVMTITALKFYFYRCTVHSDICKVHPPTNSLLLI